MPVPWTLEDSLLGLLSVDRNACAPNLLLIDGELLGLAAKDRKVDVQSESLVRRDGRILVARRENHPSDAIHRIVLDPYLRHYPLSWVKGDAVNSCPALFEEKERTDAGRGPRTESHYSFLNRSPRQDVARVRERLSDWFSRYPEAHGPDLVGRFRSTDDRHFHGAVFELYLHELLTRLGYAVAVHPENPSGKPDRPDFLATLPDGSRFYVEARHRSESDKDRAAEYRKNRTYDLLSTSFETADFYLGLDTRGAPATQPREKELVDLLRKWLAGLDADAVATAAGHDRDALPTLSYEQEGWQIEFRAHPKPKERRGIAGVDPIYYISGDATMVDTRSPIRGALKKKSGSKYGTLDAPLIVAVNVGGGFLEENFDVDQALLGDWQWMIDPTPRSRDAVPGPRKRNGTWFGPAGVRNRRVGAVLVANNVGPATLATSRMCLVHNPYLDQPVVSGPICSLVQLVPDGDVMKWISGAHPREILGLPEGWPARVTGT